MSKFSCGLLGLAFLLLTAAPSACSKSDGGFGIYLADSGEMVLSVDDVKAYHSLDYSFELNADGMARWNSFQTYTAEPNLSQGLYQRDFVIKTDGNDLCRGKFYSGVSSMSYDGIVIMDSIVNLDSNRDSIRLDFGYPAPAFASPAVESDKTRITNALARFFYVRYKLVQDEGFWTR
jgi:hypothetical protein